MICQVIIRAPNRLQQANTPTLPINVPEILAARGRIGFFLSPNPSNRKIKRGSDDFAAFPVLGFVVSPARFERATYGFEEQES
jgi:hypothetical protein